MPRLLIKYHFTRILASYKVLILPAAAAVPTDHHSGSMSVIMELRRIAMHPLLARHWYHDDTLREMVEEIRRRPEGVDTDPAYLYEDLALMTDFELHNYCMEKKVSIL